MMAQIRCISASLEHIWAFRHGRRLQRVAELVPGVINENVVQRRALHGERRDSDVGVAGGFEQSDRGARAVVGGQAKDIVFRFQLGDVRQGLESFWPIIRHLGKADFEDVLAGNRRLLLQWRIERHSFAVIHNGDAVAEFVRLIHVMRGDEDGEFALALETR